MDTFQLADVILVFPACVLRELHCGHLPDGRCNFDVPSLCLKGAPLWTPSRWLSTNALLVHFKMVREHT